MALFKILKGLKANLPSNKTAGHCWYTTDDSLFYIDFEDENGEVQRKALNAKSAEKLAGASLASILNATDLEIPTSLAVLTAIEDSAIDIDPTLSNAGEAADAQVVGEQLAGKAEVGHLHTGNDIKLYDTVSGYGTIAVTCASSTQHELCVELSSDTYPDLSGVSVVLTSDAGEQVAVVSAEGAVTGLLSEPNFTLSLQTDYNSADILITCTYRLDLEKTLHDYILHVDLDGETGDDGSTTSVILDTTLSLSGAAAEAKATGDAIEELKTDILQQLEGYALRSEVPSTEGLATETYVQEEIAKIDVSDKLTDYALKSEIPSTEGFATEAYVQEEIAKVNMSGGAGDGTSTAVQADWNETDETSPAYIKNKPDISGGSGGTIEEIILTEQTLEFTSTSDGFVYNQSGMFVLENGEEYRVLWDDNEYACKGYLLEMRGHPAVFLGNESVVKGESTELIEPFIIYEVKDNNYCNINAATDITATSHTVAIYKVIKSTSVQPDWAQIDDTQMDYIKNKPFYDTTSTVLECVFQDELIDTNGDGVNDNWSGELAFIDTSSTALIPGKTYTIMWNGVEYTSTCELLYGQAPVIGNVELMTGVGDNGIPFVIARDVTGKLSGEKMWMAVLTSAPDPTSSGTYTCKITTDDVKYLDNKYLSILNYNPPTDIELLPITTYNGFAFDSGYGVYGVSVAASYALTTGEPYTVYWDGTTYECVAQDASSLMTGCIVLGNATAWGLSGNNEPFVIGVFNNIGASYFSTTDTEDGGSHSVGIIYNAKENYKLNSEYISDVPWDKISDKPFGNIPAGTVVLEEVVTTGSAMSDTNGGGAILNSLKSQYIIADADYTVEFNGLNLNGIGVVEGDGSGIIIRNIHNEEYGSIILNYSNSGIHLFINNTSYIPNDTTGFIKITFAEDTIVPIPSNYLPDGIGGSSALPEVTTSDNDKVLTVVNGAWTAQTPASGLPDVTASDNDKVLKVVNGVWTVSDEMQELPSVTSDDDGKVLFVSGGTWVMQTPVAELPVVTADDVGKFLRVGSDGSWIVEAIQDVSEVGL